MIDIRSFHGPNAGYVQDAYERYLSDPSSVPAEMQAIFAQMSLTFAEDTPQALPSSFSAPQAATPLRPDQAVRISRAASLARTIRGRGHLAACLDPLGSLPPGDTGLESTTHELTPDDLRALPGSVVSGEIGTHASNALQALEELREIYEGTTGYDYGHVQIASERAWLRTAIEARTFHAPLSDGERTTLLKRLTEVEAFERFLGTAFAGQKRFSIEGTDMLVPLLDDLIRAAAHDGTREVVMGMAHRGRLNVLAHILRKPYGQIIEEFQHSHHGEGPAASDAFNNYGWTGDVKYHLGAQSAFEEDATAHMTLTLAPNPSHLEFVNPVIEGMARAVQDRRAHPGQPIQDEDAALPIAIHGDAAFPGEGIAAETLNISRLMGYRTGGTIHIIVNNQLGFTTEPSASRSTLYASDVAKGFEIPVVHVNADDPEAVLAAGRLAHAYRQQFHKDFLIDLIGYRRHGHNEGDEPLYTSPQMYTQISAHPTVRAQWAERLVHDRAMTADETESMLRTQLDYLQTIKESGVDALEPHHDDLAALRDPDVVETGVDEILLRHINEHILTWPDGFALNPRLERLLLRRRDAMQNPNQIDWGHAETLALGTILTEGTPIRMAGQDTERGTFSQRHLVLHNITETGTFTALQTLPAARASFAVYNSPLSEAAVLGFEYGYSEHARDTLVIWEAQFGDFANAAQVIIDQFIMPARAKWRQVSGLVLLLPHGAEGQGPEHSSARLERYLQLAAANNVRIVNCTTAAQYFHLLRRQAWCLAHSGVRPLIVMTPKSLLRDPLAASSLGDLVQGSFQPVLDDARAAQHPDDITRIILCTGKVYIDLAKAMAAQPTPHVAAVRVEELYPFPKHEIEHILHQYGRNLQEVVWLQEEPQNMGAWTFVGPRLRDLINRTIALSYAGRDERSSPAAGSAQQHAAEQAEVLARALTGAPAPQASHRTVRGG